MTADGDGWVTCILVVEYQIDSDWGTMDGTKLSIDHIPRSVTFSCHPIERLRESNIYLIRPKSLPCHDQTQVAILDRSWPIESDH